MKQRWAISPPTAWRASDFRSHGANGSGQQVERESGFDAQADRLGWIAAYPDGVGDGWEPFG